MRRLLFASGDLAAVLDHRKRNGNLPLDRIRHPYHRHLRDIDMRLHRLFDLARAQTMTGDINHVIGAAEDVVVAVLVADAPVKG